MEGETSTRVLDFLNKLLTLELPSFAYSLCLFLISRLDSELSKLVRYKAFVSLMKCAAIKCYSPYFTPERFYSIGKTLEEIKDMDLAKRVVSKLSVLIREKLLPTKYASYLVLRSVCFECRWCSGS